ncbi:MAG: lipid-A-disaccharide synthase N-terminal domain-containing protein [Phycisphaerales bacterium]|nr:lipid-A-disaccharide synthase N-terminal domain-containing protein [Phycisphaerales bacterium]
MRASRVFKLLNITSWASVAWVVMGLAGQLAFSGRMLLQWFLSEKRGQSVVPEVFWWLSLAGGAMLFAYFVWRRDLVAVLGQTSGLVIYARNLRLIGKHKRRAARAGQAAESVG